MDYDVLKEIEGGEKRSGSPVVANSASKKHRSELVEESNVGTEEPTAEIIKESIAETKIHFPMLECSEGAPIFRSINEWLLLQRGFKWIVYRLMVHNDHDEEKFRSSVESLKKDYNTEKSLIEFFEGPPKFVMVAMEANTLEAKAKAGVGIGEIVDRFYGVSDIYQTSNQAKVTAQLLLFESEVQYLINRTKIQRLALAQHCAINIYTSGYPSCFPLQRFPLQGVDDMMVHVEGKPLDVCTTLVGIFLCVNEEFRYEKSVIHSMGMKMRNLPSSGLAREVYVYGRDAPKLMVSFDDKKKISVDVFVFGKPNCVVKLTMDHADLLTRERGKLINSIRASLAAGVEVRLTDCGSGSIELSIVGDSESEVPDAVKMIVEMLRERGDVEALKLHDEIVKKGEYKYDRWCYLTGDWSTDAEGDEDDECMW
ncbi:unnamed protein product [Cuscuta campestris]|uniref:Uncharacterized protein n=1 Tax=Cuscuta campestris TaxID=132261 RepID=A0A484MDT1_9ASTE|nr:unnamed protein product [Cuscuta campestris]